MDQVKKTEACPLCDGHRLEVRHDLATKFRYLAKEFVLDGQEHTVCPGCGFSFFDDGQIERNNELFYALEAKVVKGISPRKILELRQKYDITQAQAAKIFKCAKHAFSKWERGEVAPAAGLANILNLALEHPEFMRFMADKAGEKVDLPSPQKMVPHAEYAALQDVLALRDKEDHIRRKESYEAGRKDGMRQSYQVILSPSKMVREEAYGKQISSEDVLVEHLVWQKEKHLRLRPHRSGR